MTVWVDAPGAQKAPGPRASDPRPHGGPSGDGQPAGRPSGGWRTGSPLGGGGHKQVTPAALEPRVLHRDSPPPMQRNVGGGPSPRKV